MEKKQRLNGKHLKFFFILFLIVMIGLYFVYQTNFSKTDFRPYKPLIWQFLFDDDNQHNVTSNATQLTNIENLKFAKIHRNILSNRNEKRIVFYQIIGVGYGNRVYSMLSAFLVAVITDSALLINWPQIDSYIQSPLVDVFKRFNDLSFLDFNQKSPEICNIKTKTSNTWSSDKQFEFLQDLRLPNCSRFFISDMTPYFFDVAANLKYSQKLIDYGFVQAATVEKALQSLNNSTVPKNQKLDNLFAIGFEFAGHVLNNYWLLKPYLQDKIEKFTQNKFKEDFIIGIQMRFEYMNSDDIDRFFKCAMKIESSHNASTVSNRKVKWFLSTDKSDVIPTIIKKYGEKIITGEGKIGHVVNHGDAYERAIMDVELLSRCDHLILTGGSTFGFIAAIKGQKRPYYVEGKRQMSECKLFDFSSPPRTPSGYAIFR